MTKVNKKLILILFYFCLFPFHLKAQQPTEEWVRRWNNNGSNVNGLKIKSDPAGNVYVMCVLTGGPTNGDFYLLKYSPAGNLIWTASYNSPGDLGDAPYAFDLDKSGNIYMTGTSGTGFTKHITTVKFDSAGHLAWYRVYDGGGPEDGVTDLKVDKNDDIIITGGTYNNVSKGLTVKYSPGGDSLWVRKFSSLPEESGNSGLAVDDSNNIYIAGSYLMPTSADYLILKYDVAGNLKWYSTYNSPQNNSDAADFIAIDTNRNVYVVGTTYFPGYQFNNTLIKLNTSGSLQWSSIYTGILGGNGRCLAPKGLAVTPDGNSIYYTTYCWNGVGSQTNIVTLKYNSNGDSVWSRQYSGTGTSNDEQDWPRSLRIDIYGSIYVTGRAYNQPGANDFVSIKYLPNGTQQWVAVYNGPLANSDDGANDLIVDSNLIYVTGTGSRQNTPQFLWDAVTIKYSQPIGITGNSNEMPKDYKLHQNYPNPFNPLTTITYELPKLSNIKLIVFNILGQEIITIVNQQEPAGYYSNTFNMDSFPSGIYFFSLIIDGNVLDSKKLILMK